MSLLKSKMNGLSVGIFSAEVGARQWMHAHNHGSYLIWKIGKKKNDELLYIGDAEVDAEMAKRAGVPFVAYKRPDLPADIYVNSFLELAEVLGINFKG